MDFGGKRHMTSLIGMNEQNGVGYEEYLTALEW